MYIEFPHCSFNSVSSQYYRQYYKDIKSPCFKNASFLKKCGKFCIKKVFMAT